MTSQRFGRSRARRGEPLPKSGTVFVSVRDADKRAIVSRRRHARGLGLVVTAGTARPLDAGIGWTLRRRSPKRPAMTLHRRPHPSRPLRPRDQHASRAQPAGRLSPEGGARFRVPGVTTVAAPPPASGRPTHAPSAPSLQERPETAAARRHRARGLGPYTLLRVERGEVDPGALVSSSCPGTRRCSRVL
jgi:hypothetical protein